MGKKYSVWNERIGNFCAATGKTENDFIYPLQPLKLSEFHKDDWAEILQTIYYKRTGEIGEEIGASYETDKQIAKIMKCWD